MARLEREVERDSDAMDADDQAAFQEDIEEDPSIRQSVTIYRSKEDSTVARSTLSYNSQKVLAKERSHKET